MTYNEMLQILGASFLLNDTHFGSCQLSFHLDSYNQKTIVQEIVPGQDCLFAENYIEMQ